MDQKISKPFLKQKTVNSVKLGLIFPMDFSIIVIVKAGSIF